MDSYNLILEKLVQVEEMSVKYQIRERESIFEGNSQTFYDISVEKTSHGKVESCVCPALTTNIDVAKKVCNLISESIVLPETLYESLEECLEVVL